MIVLIFPPLLFSLCFHEYSHAWVANKLGDPTAKYMGRLTLNPMAHISITSTILFPIILSIMGLPPLGAAKPVPIDPRNFKDPQRGMALSAIAGPISNIALGAVFAFILAIMMVFVKSDNHFLIPLAQMLWQGVYINMIFAFFNLIPIPPLDGSRVITMFLSYKQAARLDSFAPYSFILIIVLLYVGALNIILVPVEFFSHFFVNISYNVLTGLF
jgi:Zn-dependent protease